MLSLNLNSSMKYLYAKATSPGCFLRIFLLLYNILYFLSDKPCLSSNSINLTESIPLKFQNTNIGELRSAAFSPKFGSVVGIAMIKKQFCQVLHKFQINLNNKSFDGQICNLPII